MIARFFNFKDRDNILKEARRTEGLQWENHKILIFPDYTREVQTRRRSYEHVKQKLKAMQLSYMLLFPARLKVLMAGKAYFFESPENAWDWLTEEGVGARREPMKPTGGALREGPPVEGPGGAPDPVEEGRGTQVSPPNDEAVRDPDTQTEGVTVGPSMPRDTTQAADDTRLSQSLVLG
ncbi:hypothetical protein NDU88_008060 [Pleurodeles waltl]|uniref:Uncharacterized protein n=1 Tax=Pleurodeles waltl TaxID=8319 RepID=A0AAV7RWN1_PLEWA|nr:hypothetical protein NDU88_008060 [Pleurodeles waltl]